ncbi:NAD(P)/FAD-dependent oxidoreductase [Chitinophagaceae bacterium LB-8]|uniref:NAD(P)/FAD-dependent oxidoreductase n=1 Tax=Paraflavisolibacter caeni TaxID=2982496 RepID=A0A9X2XSQ5_9BACT|nr:NAD(P)/FAD-dependent oxidoreductase [Paraflavisolibacter caeni]MCU7548040.1 NAD(P)/FAD-dependent oxidoreductase [Paraflavisolibacter caeni]
MSQLNSIYDVAIVGGGLAGLSLSIQLSSRGYTVVLFEKERYPFHKVCGEYISMESWNFLESLGFPLTSLSLPRIEKLQLSAPNGRKLTAELPLGGFGVSRYMIDANLASIARARGVLVLEETKVSDILFDDQEFIVSYQDKEDSKQLTARICCGTFGKRSNLDIKWKRNFLEHKSSHHRNYIGVKYHIMTDWPANVIGLHNFQDGYCGISKIEDDRYCLCYMTTAANLKKHNSSIPEMEREILFKNPSLKKIFTHSEILPGFPLAISQINFSVKSQLENGVLLLGDAAGTITPLCGNGMSMALHSSKIAARLIEAYLKNLISRGQMESDYTREWRHQFYNRLRTGRILQNFFGDERLSNLFVGMFQVFPFLSKAVIKKTHGQPF